MQNYSLTSQKLCRPPSASEAAADEASARPKVGRKTLRKALTGRTAEPALEPSLAVAEVRFFVDGWLMSGEASIHSPQTLALRRIITGKLLWFLGREKAARCGRAELLAFFAYMTRGHLEPGGRWGNPQQTRPVRPETVRTYQRHLRAFFTWAVREGALSGSPLDRIDPPPCRKDQIQPFSEAQITALLAAARKTQNAARDEAIVWMLYDTGIRASELCGLRRKDLDLTAKKMTVLGKGNKVRSVYFGWRPGRALWLYLGQDEWDPAEPLFASERARDKGNALHRYGLRDLIYRLGQAAGLEGVRCSAHTFRHTHALEYLRCGGSVEGLRERLGHERLEMTLKYVALAEADMANQRRFSPADHLGARAGAGRDGMTRPPQPLPEPPAAEPARQRRPPSAVRPGGRGANPNKASRARLSEEDVRAIRRLAGTGPTLAQIGERFGVARSTVKDIVRGVTWGVDGRRSTASLVRAPGESQGAT